MSQFCSEGLKLSSGFNGVECLGLADSCDSLLPSIRVCLLQIGMHIAALLTRSGLLAPSHPEVLSQIRVYSDTHSTP